MSSTLRMGKSGKKSLHFSGWCTICSPKICRDTRAPNLWMRVRYHKTYRSASLPIPAFSRMQTCLIDAKRLRCFGSDRRWIFLTYRTPTDVWPSAPMLSSRSKLSVTSQFILILIWPWKHTSHECHDHVSIISAVCVRCGTVLSARWGIPESSISWTTATLS